MDESNSRTSIPQLIDLEIATVIRRTNREDSANGTEIAILTNFAPLLGNFNGLIVPFERTIVTLFIRVLSATFISGRVALSFDQSTFDPYDRMFPRIERPSPV